MSRLFRKRKAKYYEQSDAAQCQPEGEVSTEDWEDYVLVTVDAAAVAQKPPSEQPSPTKQQKICSLESSLDSGYEEIHMPPPPSSEEESAAGQGSICSAEAKQVSGQVQLARCIRVASQLHSCKVHLHRLATQNYLHACTCTCSSCSLYVPTCSLVC